RAFSPGLDRASVIAGHSALKTRVNALMTRQSVFFAKTSFEEDGPPEIGFTRFRAFKCASRINPTCVVKPAGDACTEPLPGLSPWQECFYTKKRRPPRLGKCRQERACSLEPCRPPSST